MTQGEQSVIGVFAIDVRIFPVAEEAAAIGPKSIDEIQAKVFARPNIKLE